MTPLFGDVGPCLDHRGPNLNPVPERPMLWVARTVRDDPSPRGNAEINTLLRVSISLASIWLPACTTDR
jgi:hypothetical protein